MLLDETTAREHAYTAMSRGRRGNDVFIAEHDHRVEERHAKEVEVDALDVLRAVLNRSAAQRFALDQVEPSRVPRDLIGDERDALRQRIGKGPPDHSREFRELNVRREREERYLGETHWRVDVWQKKLDELGPIGRRIHRSQRREIEDRIAGFEGEIARHEERLSQLDRELDTLAPQVSARAEWEHETRDDLDRLATLDREIDAAVRRTRDAARGLDSGVEHHLGMEL